VQETPPQIFPPRNKSSAGFFRCSFPKVRRNVFPVAPGDAILHRSRLLLFSRGVVAENALSIVLNRNRLVVSLTQNG
jgi:hypothetical protein